MSLMKSKQNEYVMDPDYNYIYMLIISSTGLVYCYIIDLRIIIIMIVYPGLYHIQGESAVCIGTRLN